MSKTPKRAANTRANKLALSERDGRYCPRCGVALNVVGHPSIKGGQQVMIHHVIPLVNGGTDELDNLMLSCIPCERVYHQLTDALHRVRNKALTKLHKYSDHLTIKEHPDFRVKQCAKDIVVMIDHLKLDPRPSLKRTFLWWLQHKIVERLAKCDTTTK